LDDISAELNYNGEGVLAPAGYFFQQRPDASSIRDLDAA
jgi:hypothetical protein